MEGGARVSPPITHPRGMEGVPAQLRTSPGAYGHMSGDAHFAFKSATAADDLRAEAGGLTPVAHPRHHALVERKARVDTLPAWHRADATASTATQRTPSKHEDAATVYRSGTPHSPLRYTAGCDQISYTRRTLQSVAEGALRLSGAPAGHCCSLSPSAPIPLPDTSRTARSARQRSTLDVVRLDSIDVASIAESVSATMRTVYAIGKKYISHFSSNVTSVAQDLSRALSDEQRDTHSPTAGCTASLPSPRLPAGRPCMTPPVPSTSHAHSRTPSSCGVDYIPRTDRVQSTAPHEVSVCGHSGTERPDAHMPFNGLSLPPYVVDTHAAGSVPSVAAVAPRDDGRSNPRGCDMSYMFQSSPPSAAANDSIKSTSQCTPALEGGAGVLQPKSRPLVMEGASTEDVLPAYAETSAPGKDSRFALESRTPYTTAKVPSEKHLRGAGPEDKSALLNAATVEPVLTHTCRNP
ncbi:hypothetical protein EXIGLDRAFT_764012 [Exidia glandulosa HHB12029]|uniref:Uncharacterized protein n=1 Tax=Exidia glandulosa HHB12029 TaxID=1314781 RepID=A0A165LGF6_EXIGL|nr:hypothetical protein EXIGLDRAFT_764012 [Exidia glandulosa HHB12029]